MEILNLVRIIDRVKFNITGVSGNEGDENLHNQSNIIGIADKNGFATRGKMKPLGSDGAELPVGDKHPLF